MLFTLLNQWYVCLYIIIWLERHVDKATWLNELYEQAVGMDGVDTPYTVITTKSPCGAKNV